jgi:hypothetical protein
MSGVLSMIWKISAAATRALAMFGAKAELCPNPIALMKIANITVITSGNRVSRECAGEVTSEIVGIFDESATVP